MKTKRKKQDPLVEYIKANRKGSREAELENHGRPVVITGFMYRRKFIIVKE